MSTTYSSGFPIDLDPTEPDIEDSLAECDSCGRILPGKFADKFGRVVDCGCGHSHEVRS